MQDDLHERIRRGDPGVFDEPSPPASLASGAVPVDVVRDGAVAYLLGGGSPRPWLLDLAAAWWREHGDGAELGRLLGRLGERAGAGSAEHRRAVLAGCLCARVVAPMGGLWQRSCERCLDRIERWAWGDHGIDVGAVHREAADLAWDATAHAADTHDPWRRPPAVAAESAASAVRDAVACALHTSCAERLEAAIQSAARALAAFEPERPDDLIEENLRALADLLRAAVPACPLGEVQRGAAPA